MKQKNEIQTIQKTGKFWKGIQLISFLACVAGAGLLVVSPAASVLILFGICFFCIGRIGAWWFHG